MPRTAVRLVATGKVQNVWYRESCRRTAEHLGVSGWVRNNADGSVEAHLEGDHAAVEKLVEWCRGGSTRAEVSELRLYDEEPEGASGFVVA